MGFKKGIKSGYYEPVNPEKWIITESFDMKKGKPGIKYRSSWEHMFFKFMDFNDNIVKANSEGMVIPYQNPVTGKTSKYYMDAMMETKGGKIWLVEIKPYAQTIPPKPPRGNSKNPQKAEQNYIKAIETYAINQAKWKATEILCEEKGWIFKIITEKELGL
jgi:hypothetical protein